MRLLSRSALLLLVACAPSALCFPSESAARQSDLVPTVVVHGGAGDIEEDELEGKYNGTKEAVRAAFRVLEEEGGSAADAVSAALRLLEDDPHFNAGRGSALTSTGDVENDASIMLGATMGAGSVASITSIRNPIDGAREVLENTPHVQLAGDRATEWLVAQGLQTEDEVSMAERNMKNHQPFFFLLFPPPPTFFENLALQREAKPPSQSK